MTKLAEEIFALREQGRSYRDIEKLLGCSKSTIAYYCGEGVKAKTFARTRQKQNKIVKYIQEYKQQHGCQDCKEMYPYYILELDHVKGTKVKNVSDMSRTHNLDQVKEEIAKCEVVCSNCHKIRTYSRKLTSGDSVIDIAADYI